MQCKSCHTCTCTRTDRTLIFTAHTYYLGSYLATHHRYELNRARTGFTQVNKTRTTFGNPDQIWQPKVVRGRTNFGSEKWSPRTTFCPDQFSRDSQSTVTLPPLKGAAISPLRVSRSHRSGCLDLTAQGCLNLTAHNRSGPIAPNGSTGAKRESPVQAEAAAAPPPQIGPDVGATAVIAGVIGLRVRRIGCPAGQCILGYIVHRTPYILGYAVPLRTFLPRSVRFRITCPPPPPPPPPSPDTGNVCHVHMWTPVYKQFLCKYQTLQHVAHGIYK